MNGGKGKVFVALSGGVDSSTAAAVLLGSGFDCSGVFMITCDQMAEARIEAEQIAERLGIRLYVLDLRRDFERIFEYFRSEYKKGRTPNPCVRCNSIIKFGKLPDFARDNGAQFFATGHYARILRADGRVGLYEAFDSDKDQSYVLSMIDKEKLPYIIFPLGDYSKSQTRQLAAQFDLGTEKNSESQEICFISGDYVSVLEQRCPEFVCRGDIIDSGGKVLGEHNGVHRFTIGQRRGLGVAMGEPYYVTGIDSESNTVTLGPKEEVMHSKLVATGLNWLGQELRSSFRARIKIRYNDAGSNGTVFPEADKVVVEFDEANSAITPGQLAVFYVQEGQNSRVVGGGWIERAGG